ncbi:uncharacterized protein TM35_000153140 [Trypanosoma theileri]|uniref:Uncharacterized protein n=1 Tax=Trypanosoma theileri TaxID=67003 RepID=A0A1X0NWN3_9TRYP|nr:uncharacterized protein TM35_000153140 [Trypanosoma theileri]ORC88883.1 hypothetical protein TM35_000153140 [Trypanosoma theileri]
MDKARPFEYVYRLPSSTLEELTYREAVYDRQVLLNETWESYALRKGRLKELEDEHVKWITRTWDDEEIARDEQRSVLEKADYEWKLESAAKEREMGRKKERSLKTVEKLMAFEERSFADRIPCRHNLYVDFDLFQQQKFIGEQNIISMAENMLRVFIEEAEDGICFGIALIGECNRIMYLTRLQDRLLKEEEERQRIAEEQRRLLEEEKRKEELRQKELEEAERLRKEAMEQAKILERKKRDEERRAKARSEREKIRQRQSVVDFIVATEESPPKLTASDVVATTIEPTLPVSENVIPTYSDRKCIVYSQPKGDDVISLIKNASSILSDAGDCSYVMSIDKIEMKSTVICENGSLFGETNNNESHRLLGKTINEKTAISISSEKLHGTKVFSLENYYSSRVEYVLNSRTNDKCFLFDSSASKNDESIVFLPLLVSGFNYAPYVFAVSRNGSESFQPNEVKEAAKVVWELSNLINLYLEKEKKIQLCQQCVEWLTTVTGCNDCYVSLRDQENDELIYVAASPSHNFMIGKKHSLIEEKNGVGISFKACEAASQDGNCMVFCIDDISDNSCIPFENQKVKIFSEEQKTGSLLLGTLTGKNDNKECVSLGVVFMDYLGTDKKFTDSEKEIFKTALEMLSNLLLNHTNDSSLGKRLKIEDDIEGLSSSSITFLKSLWSHTLNTLNNITPSQLSELGNYLHPPPIIPLVVQATLIIALGSKPQKVAKWEDAREKITNKLLAKMSDFDPTDPKKRKKAFFVRGGKMLKGYGVKDVFEKGSYPTSCFFSWTFAAILLRKHADILRKSKSKNGTNLEFEYRSSVVSEEEGDEDNEPDSESEEDV